ncbi:hypothetical protein D3870_04235 [Noviherbaspirillum cavernae]|uniref:Uncharacterized protein n=1 Tax=Noviherbaspirillum cavernae TaxID=2320862 RepID=A0A418WYT5_9BURK|nr:hypothetical protein [Noviherbaspirillum cavernae]RJG05331.1 hypothetical protein D3870_04235 [Noviherbaspirillum cavernae]
MKNLPMARRKQGGQSFMEYLVVLAFGVIVLVAGPNPPIQQLAKAIRDYYTDYSYAISISSMPNCFASTSGGAAGVSGTVTTDKCLDLSDPKWPVDVSFD